MVAMTDDIQYDVPTNPLYYGLPLRHAIELPVFGIRVRYESNSADAIAAVEDAFGGWRALEASPELISSTRVRVRLIVHDGDEGEGDHAPMSWRLPDAHRLLI